MAQTPPAPAVNPADIYEQIMVRYVFGPLADETLQTVRPKPGDRILDLAAGTGIVLRRVAGLVQRPGRLVAVDMSPAMITYGRSITEPEGLPIEWHEGLAENLQFPDGSFDWVFCQNGVQFFQDRQGATREMHRVLNSGGTAVISVWQSIERHRYFLELDGIAFEHAGIHMFADPFSLDDPDALRRLLEEAGFRDIRIETPSITMRAPEPRRVAELQLISATFAIPSLRQLSQEQRDDLIRGVMESASAIIDEHTVDGMLTMAWHANVAIGTRA